MKAPFALLFVTRYRSQSHGKAFPQKCLGTRLHVQRTFCLTTSSLTLILVDSDKMIEEKSESTGFSLSLVIKHG